MIKRVIQTLASLTLLSGVCAAVPGYAAEASSVTDIPASDAIPVNLTLSDGGTAVATYTDSIVSSADAILTTPASINLALDSTAVEGVEEGQSTEVTVSAVDAFGNPWPRALTVPISYDGSEAFKEGAGFVDLPEGETDSINGVAVSGGEASGDLSSPTALGEIGGTAIVEVTGYLPSRYQSDSKADVYSFSATDTATYSISAQTSVGDRSFDIYPAESDFSREGSVLSFLTAHGQATSDYKTFDLTAGATYVIRVRGYDGSGTYSFSLGVPDFGGPDSAEIAASAGEARTTISVKTDQSTESGSSGNGETITMKIDSANLPTTAKAGDNATATLTIVDVPQRTLLLSLDHVGLVTQQPTGRVGTLSVKDYAGTAEYRLLSASDPVGDDVCVDGADDHNSFFSISDSSLNLADSLAGTSPPITEVRLCLAAQIATNDGVEEFAQAFTLDVYATPQLTFSQTWHGYDSTLMTQPSLSIVLRDSMLNHPDFVDGTAPHPPRIPTMGSFDVTESALDSRLSNARFTIVGPADSTRNNCVSASSTATVNAVFNRGITGNTLNTPVDIDLKASPANFDICLQVVLDDSAGATALEYEQIFSLRTVFELEQNIELADLAESLNLDSSKVRFNTLTGVLTADFGGSQASCKPISVTDAPEGSTAGSSINDDGLLEIVTEDGKLLTCSGAVEDLEKFKEAATPQSTLAAMSVVEQVQSKEFSLSFNLACVGGDCQSLVKNDICSALALGAADCGRVIVNRVSATSNLRAPGSSVSALMLQDSQTSNVSKLSADDLLGESYFFRPSVMTLEVSSSAALGMRSLLASADSSLNTMHYVYEDDLGVRRSQEMLPVVARWEDVQTSIGILAGVEDVGIDDRGVLSISGSTLTLRYLPDYEVRVYGNFTGQSSSGATIEYNSLGDINGDGRDDVEIVHSDGLRQYLFQLPEQTSEASSLSK